MKKREQEETNGRINCRSHCFFDLLRVCVLCVSLAVVSVSSAWGNTILQDVKLTVQQKNVTISKVLDEIEQKTGYSILVRNIDTNVKVSVNQKDANLNRILETLFAGMNVKFEVEGKKISIYRPEKVVQTISVGKEHKVTGVIVDTEGEPIIGANVLEKGTASNGTITDVDGNFTINVAPNATLIISYIGFNTQEIAVNGKSALTIKMANDVKALEEVVVVGYSSQKKASLTGAISNVKVDENLRTISSSNMTNLLAGTMSGLNISSTTGLPGTSSKMMVRTQSSFAKDADGNLIPTSPIFVIDGIVREKSDFDRLDANEVDNVTVLKDAASAAIYGARASGGVVLVSTRKGKVGKPMLS